jgi:hypothetical protein
VVGVGLGEYDVSHVRPCRADSGQCLADRLRCFGHSGVDEDQTDAVWKEEQRTSKSIGSGPAIRAGRWMSVETVRMTIEDLGSVEFGEFVADSWCACA